LGVAGLLVVLGSVWGLLARDSAQSAQRRATTPVLWGAEADGIVSERDGFGTPLRMTSATPRMLGHMVMAPSSCVPTSGDYHRFKPQPYPQ